MKKILIAVSVLIVASLACSLFQGVAQQVSPQSNVCSMDKWKIFISSVEQKDQGDGTKDVTIYLAVQNNDHLWGTVVSSQLYNDSKAFMMTTTAGKEYGPTSKNFVLNMPNGDIITYGSGYMNTLLLPPGATVTGQSIRGIPTFYGFMFNIPSAETPATFTINTLTINCVGNPRYVMVNGEPVYGGGTLYIPPLTYDMRAGAQGTIEEPSAGNYPGLKGSKLVETTGEYEFTDVSRQGNTITITLNFTNRSKYQTGPSFAGYILGDQGQITCPETYEMDCQVGRSGSPEVQPGDTITGVTWTFVVPKDEKNLLFVYVQADSSTDTTSKVYNLGQ